jgi:hypothetical protein
VKPWDTNRKPSKPRVGRKKRFDAGFLPLLPELDFFDGQTHGFTVGYWLARLRR